MGLGDDDDDTTAVDAVDAACVYDCPPTPKQCHARERSCVMSIPSRTCAGGCRLGDDDDDNDAAMAGWEPMPPVPALFPIVSEANAT